MSLEWQWICLNGQKRSLFFLKTVFRRKLTTSSKKWIGVAWQTRVKWGEKRHTNRLPFFLEKSFCGDFGGQFLTFLKVFHKYLSYTTQISFFSSFSTCRPFWHVYLVCLPFLRPFYSRIVDLLSVSLVYLIWISSTFFVILR